MEGGSSAARRGAPRWATLLLVLGAMAAVLAFLVSVIAAGLVFPFFDLTPLVILGIAWFARRWDARSSRWFSATLVLSAIMIVQWIAWDLWFVRMLNVATPYTANQMVGPLVQSLSRIYLLELGALLVLFVVASAFALLGIRRQRMAARKTGDSPGEVQPSA